jgi:GT2 family glycosyltransferase
MPAGDETERIPPAEMGPSEDPAQAISALAVRQDQLERLLGEVRRSLAEAREQQQEALEKLESQVKQLQSRIHYLNHLVHSILRSRTWRALVAGGGLLLRARDLLLRMRVRGPLAGGPARARSLEHVFELVCDSPRGGGDPRGGAGGPPPGLSGTVVVKGWALASSGITRVEVQAGTAAPVEARYGLYRPDVARHYRDVPNAERSGYQASLDTGSLPDGEGIIVIRAFAASGSRKEIQVPLWIDHIHGYADDYHRWIAEFEQRDAAPVEAKLSVFPLQPLVSLIMPVYRTRLEFLEKAIGSVKAQSYPRWELCVADDCSGSPEIDALLERHAKQDGRIKVVRLLRHHGISGASNAALDAASGEFVALLDSDDELAPDALFHFVEALNREPEADLFYSDEDHLDETGLRSDPFFKPDWSPDLILAENYVCHLLIFRRELCFQVGGFRSEYDLSQDHDLLLRMSRKARKIVHIPKILYHWRTNVASGERTSERYPQQALDSSRRAVEDHLRAMGVQATVEPGEAPSRWRVRYVIPANQLVRMIVCCGGKLELLERCLQSVVDKTEYPHYEIVVVDNSRTAKVEQFVRAWGRRGRRAHYVDFRNRPFNFSAMNNAVARDCAAPLLLFLNDDVSVITPGWLTAMVELASRPEVGAVGAKLLYPEGRIQHAGVVLGISGLCGHAFRGVFAADRVYFDFPDVIRNVSAVTGACMITPTRRFWECGGFDEEAFPVAYQDVDLCLKLGHKGYRILYTPHAQLYHCEAASKRPEDVSPTHSEAQALLERWKEVIENDPFYSPNLTRTAEDYSCRKRAESRP